MAKTSQKTLPQPAIDNGRLAISKWWSVAAIVALSATGFFSTLTNVWDSDVFWHLASGHWMLDHGQVLGTDPFSVEPMKQWVNVHWLFQVIIATLHSIGGFALLSVLKACLAGATLFAFAFGLRRRVHPAWLIGCGLMLLLTIAARIRVRPEAFTMLYLVLTILLLEGARQGGNPNRLWWLVPIMLLWVNMHGIYILGLATIWAAVGGALLDRLLKRGALSGGLLSQRALLPLVVASLACLVSPWPIEAAIQPLLLWTRVSGQNDYYSYGVSELMPTVVLHNLNWYDISVEVYLIWSAILLVVGAAVVMAINHRRTPLAHVLWMLPFVLLATLARRNIALVGPVCGYLVAVHGQAVLGMIYASTQRICQNTHVIRWAWIPALALILAIIFSYMFGSFLLGHLCVFLLAVYCVLLWEIIRDLWKVLPNIQPACVLATVLCLASIAGYATEYTYRTDNSPFRFGPGLQEPEYVTGLAKFLRDLDADGDIFVNNFGDASPFIFYESQGRSQPRHLLYMDGRLEAHTLERFVSQHQLHVALRTWKSAALLGKEEDLQIPRSIRFFVIHNDAYEPLASLAQCPRYRLIAVDPVGACFADLEWEHRNPGKPPLPIKSPDLSAFDHPLTADGLVTAWPAAQWLWYRQNAPSTYMSIGQMFLSMGQYDTDEARGSSTPLRSRCTLIGGRFLSAALREGLAPESMCKGMVAQAFQNRGFQGYYEPGGAMPVNMDLARALYLYNQIDLTNLADPNIESYAFQRLRTQFLSGQGDASQRAMIEFIRNLPPVKRVNPPVMYQGLRDRVELAVREGRKNARDENVQALPLAQRVERLCSPQIGLLDQALEELQASPREGALQMLLGDLLLRKGKPGPARKAYAACQLPPADAWQLELRRALCDWIEGNYSKADETLAKLVSSTNQPLARFYRANLLEWLGQYEQARQSIAPAQSEAKELSEPINQLKERLENPGYRNP